MSVSQLIDATSDAAGEAVVRGLPWIEDTGRVAPRDAKALSKLFFERLSVLEEGTREYQYARNTLIEMNLTLVRYAARRFRNRGNGDVEDLHQVGTVGLIKAIDRFDLSREVKFSSFAVPYIRGEIMRHFRDTTWAVHVPRRLQELSGDITKAREELNRRLDRALTVADLAGHLNLPEDEITEGLVATAGYTAGSLDTPVGDDAQNSDDITYAHTLGERDPGMDLVENLHALGPLLQRLGERERRIIEMRFGQEMTQTQIATELGFSQMHISRLLTRTLAKLRTGLLTDH
ncbi:SigB/SigF/SigG family RNA polymerase sigma factor [Streptomyces sp. NPDC059943]|uniref:SigB/SigF/SigG family RNA polymerase sigma factor n=1 Tax=Streptomyces sp. NPDC059943 TaxID=3347010 RepID=UPI0036651442